MDQVWVPQLPITLSYIFNVYRSLYKTKIDENIIFQSIRGRKKYTCICSKQKALVLTKCLLVLS